MEGTCYIARISLVVILKNKLNERYEISGTTVFLLYWLQVDSQPFNIVMKFYLLLHALLLLVM